MGASHFSPQALKPDLFFLHPGPARSFAPLAQGPCLSCLYLVQGLVWSTGSGNTLKSSGIIQRSLGEDSGGGQAATTVATATGRVASGRPSTPYLRGPFSATQGMCSYVKQDKMGTLSG